MTRPGGRNCLVDKIATEYLILKGKQFTNRANWVCLHTAHKSHKRPHCVQTEHLFYFTIWSSDTTDHRHEFVRCLPHLLQLNMLIPRHQNIQFYGVASQEISLTTPTPSSQHPFPTCKWENKKFIHFSPDQECFSHFKKYTRNWVHYFQITKTHVKMTACIIQWLWLEEKTPKQTLEFNLYCLQLLSFWPSCVQLYTF